MALHRFRWLLFPVYLSVFSTLPFVILLGEPGWYLSGGITLLFLFLLRFRANQKILHRLGARPLSAVEAGSLATQLGEYARRLGIPAPHLAILETPAINTAAFGFSKHGMWVVVTRGLLSQLPREAVSAVLCRQAVALYEADIVGQTWLSRFLQLIEVRLHTPRPRFYPFWSFFRTALLYPLAVFPAWIFHTRCGRAKLDENSNKLGRNPEALAEAYRTMEAYRERLPLHMPLSLCHLFVLPPPCADPMTRMLFAAPEKLFAPVPA